MLDSLGKYLLSFEISSKLLKSNMVKIVIFNFEKFSNAILTLNKWRDGKIFNLKVVALGHMLQVVVSNFEVPLKLHG